MPHELLVTATALSVILAIVAVWLNDNDSFA